MKYTCELKDLVFILAKHSQHFEGHGKKFKKLTDLKLKNLIYSIWDEGGGGVVVGVVWRSMWK